VGRGGLGVHFVLAALAGELGMDIEIDKISGANSLGPCRALYSESCGRFIITVSPGRRERLEKIFTGLPLSLVGTVNETGRFVVTHKNGEALIDETLERLRNDWLEPFGDLI
jgi:phosphoribosylformylglycinamidine synthase subunit PurSL